MDEQPTNSPEIPTTKRNKNKLYIILGICLLAVIVVVGVIISILSAVNNGSNGQKASTAPTLTVGTYPYLYACNALSRDDIKKAGADLRDDKGGEAVTATQAIPYDQTPGGRYDLSKTIEDSLLSGTVNSKCDYILSEFSSFDQKHVIVSVSQYPSVEAAQKIFKTRQASNKGAPFPSLKDTSLVQSDSFSRDDTVTAAILLENRVIELKYSVGNVTADNAPAKLDGLATTIVKNLNNTATATKPYNFSNLGSIGDTKLIDACSALNFKKADEILGNLHYEQTKVSNDYKYGKISESSPGISSQCSVHFRYGDDDAKQPDYKKQGFADLQTRFPNELTLSIASYPSASEATSAVQGLKKSKSDTAVDFNYGDTSFAYTQSDTSLGFNSTAHHFMTVHGGSVVTVSIAQGEVAKPYTSTVKTITTDDAKKLLDSLNLK